LCHTGLVWKSTVGGRRLVFHLAGINNQNFIMRDDETGSWWQQVSGCAIAGPLTGTCLEEMAWDEITFAVFTREHPDALVLRPLESARDQYAGEDWEGEIAALPTVTPVDPHDTLAPRSLVVGVAAGDAASAWPWTALVLRGAVGDTVGGTPVVLVAHPDGRSLRCFDRRVDGETLDLAPVAGADPPALRDRRTGSLWDFGGTATSGPLAGRRLTRITCLKDYWFDWRQYHPGARVALADPLAVLASP
jgi:Protein of unknown function (DUF3179)